MQPHFKDEIMEKWESNQGLKTLRENLKKIEMTFKKANVKWHEIDKQNEPALEITISIIKHQCRSGLIELKFGFKTTDEIYKP